MKRTFIALSVITLAACSDPKDPTEDNFKTSIQDYYTQMKPACFDVYGHFPIEKPKTDKNLEALLAVGLVDKKEEEKDVTRWGTTKRQNVITYTLTDAGSKASNPAHNFMSGNVTDFCYGDYEVVEVLNFTEPATMLGQSISRVNYTFKLTNIADWINQSPVFKEDRSVRESLESTSTPIKKDATLILTNKGWVHSELFEN